MQIYVHKNNQQLGPFTEAEVRAQLAAGTISLQDHVWWQGQATWMPLGQTSLVAGAPVAPGVSLVSPPPAVPYGAAPAVHGGSSKLAIWSLVLGCLSLLCGLLTSIPAVILGHMSLSEIRRNPGMEGHGMAITGLVIGYLFIGIFVVAIACGVIIGALGNNVQDVFKTITSQLNAAQASSGASSDDSSSSTNSDSSTNAPDQSTNNATATPDSTTNAAPENK